jgi:diguanylate cyclase (GGDEF)-like protein
MTLWVLLGVEALVAAALLHLARRQLRRRVADQALHDPLTGLPGRELFENRVDVALARARRHDYRVAVLFINLDRFKLVNESLGYECGDRLLAVAAERVKACLREEDSPARIGADEFTVLLEELGDDTGAARVAQRIVEALHEPFELGAETAYVGASVGIASNTDGDVVGHDLLRKAAMAMQRAKDLGKGRYEMFEPAMMAATSRRLMLEADLRRAIDEGQLRLVYEPEVLLSSGEVLSVEALVRWHHPVEGLLDPANFIPLAEETGLILPVGRWVLEEACRAGRRLHLERPHHRPVSVSVNVSARQLERRAGLADEVADVLATTGLPPELLTLEITESVLMEHSDAAVAAVQALRDLGAEVAIDDFGTGYSSLAYLKHFPFSILKLDQSFVQGVPHPVDSAIVQSVIRLADCLGLKVTVEGIESAEQLSQLRGLGCLVGQGFYLSHPVPEEGLRALIDGSRPRSVMWPDAVAEPADGHMAGGRALSSTAATTVPFERPALS